MTCNVSIFALHFFWTSPELGRGCLSLFVGLVCDPTTLFNRHSSDQLVGKARTTNAQLWHQYQFQTHIATWARGNNKWMCRDHTSYLSRAPQKWQIWGMAEINQQISDTTLLIYWTHRVSSLSCLVYSSIADVLLTGLMWPCPVKIDSSPEL